MSYDQLKGVLENLGVPIGDRNATQMRTELDNMAKLFTAGQVIYKILVSPMINLSYFKFSVC